MMKINIKKVLAALTTPPAFLVNNIKKVKAWNKKRLGKKVIPEMDSDVLFRMIMEDFINDPVFHRQLNNVVHHSQHVKGTGGWKLDIAVEVRKWLGVNGPKIETRFKKGKKKTVVIGLHNSIAAVNSVINYFNVDLTHNK